MNENTPAPSSFAATQSTVEKTLMHNPVPLGRVDDILRPAGDNPLLQKGFVTASMDSLVNWARTGSTSVFDEGLRSPRDSPNAMFCRTLRRGAAVDETRPRATRIARATPPCATTTVVRVTSTTAGATRSVSIA